jgi:hypothetical protein
MKTLLRLVFVALLSSTTVPALWANVPPPLENEKNTGGTT